MICPSYTIKEMSKRVGGKIARDALNFMLWAPDAMKAALQRLALTIWCASPSQWLKRWRA